MGAIGPGFIAIVGGVLTLAMIAVAVSKNAQTSSVIQGAGTALGNVIAQAVAPVSGSSSNTFGTATSIGGVSQ